ncbi:MAG: aminotransferase class IV [Bacillota bacterium]|nr:aminotransferase class IV [Bacillota bacterium]
MDLCYNKYFLIDNRVLECKDFDSSFLDHGRSLYEVIRIIDGVPLFLEKHLERLINSANITGLKLSLNIDQINERLVKLIEANGVSLGNAKIVFSFENESNNCTFYAYYLKHQYPTDEQYKNGVNTILYHGERENPNAKVVNVNFRKMVDEKIREKQVYEAILVDRNGNITEGSKSNIFMIKNNEVYTAPVEAVLPGITRDTIIAVCQEAGYKLTEKKVHYTELNDLDGLFISGTSPKVLPIKRVADKEFKSSSNKVVLDIMHGYDSVINQYINNSKKEK